jgi:endonuclease III
MKNLKIKIEQINSKLIKRFGVPFRNSNKPDPLDMLIATILSQNTNDRNSFKAFQNFKKKYPDWESACTASKFDIEKTIRVAGLAPQKSNTIKNILNFLSRKNGRISLDYIAKLSNENALEELTKFIGIGVKTASCVLLFSLNRNICPVDTHVHRTLNRIGLVKTNAPDKTFILINQSLPEKAAHSFHTNLIRLGREICCSQNPKCSLCPLIKSCRYDKKNLIIVNESRENTFMLLDNV